MLRLLPTLFILGCAAFAADMHPPRFVGSPSCQSSSCHGGGVGRDQVIIWEKKDPHSRAHAVLATARSSAMAKALGIGDAQKSARCTVCHSPLQSLPAERLLAGVQTQKGVSCESCHGPAEPWLLFHTRTDVSHAQRVTAGLRELTDLYARANACVACHLNLDEDLASRGHHPEMFFELDGQMNAEPPHYKDKGTWIGPKAWLTGQAVSLRELSWKLSKKEEPTLVPRWQAHLWLLEKTGDLPSALTPQTAYSQAQSAADQMARKSAKGTWSKERTSKLLQLYAGLANEFRDSPLPPAEQVRRAELLVMAVDRLWNALKKDAGSKSEAVDSTNIELINLARTQFTFDPKPFAETLAKLASALESLPKN
jgi:hypothetical protein